MVDSRSFYLSFILTAGLYTPSLVSVFKNNTDRNRSSAMGKVEFIICFIFLVRVGPALKTLEI